MISRSKTQVPDRSISQPGRRRKALDKNARRPRDWDVTTMMFSWVWYGCALSGSGESHRPETSVSNSDHIVQPVAGMRSAGPASRSKRFSGPDNV